LIFFSNIGIFILQLSTISSDGSSDLISDDVEMIVFSVSFFVVDTFCVSSSSTINDDPVCSVEEDTIVVNDGGGGCLANVDIITLLFSLADEDVVDVDFIVIVDDVNISGSDCPTFVDFVVTAVAFNMVFLHL